MKKILFFSHVASLGGAGLCLYQLILAVKRQAVPVVVLAQDGPLVALLREQGVKVYVDTRIRPLMSNSNSTALWTNPLAFDGLCHLRSSRRAASEHCRRETPDVVHLNTCVLMHLAKSARKAGVQKVILHVREHWNVLRWDPRGWGRNRTISRYVDRIIAISKTASARFGFSEKTVVIYDWPEFSGRDEDISPQQWGVGPDKKILLVAGGRNAIKGSDVAMRAMNWVNDPAAVMLVLGGRADTNPKKEVVRKILRKLHLGTYGLMLDRIERESSGRILLLPTVKQIKSLMEQSSMVICPFTVPHVAMPSIEAGFLGKPVVISENGHARETVLDKKTGLIVPSNDADNRIKCLHRYAFNNCVYWADTGCWLLDAR